MKTEGVKELKIEPIVALRDNYIWAIHNGQQAIVVDPSEFQPADSFLKEKELALQAVFITHHHWDHIGGAKELQQKHKCMVFAPEKNKIHLPYADVYVNEGYQISGLGTTFVVQEIPGHTLGHVGYYCCDLGAYFCGDTLFCLAAGKIFEGNPTMMMQSLDRMRQLPETTQMYPAHEYTVFTLQFAEKIDPDNSLLKTFKAQCRDLRKKSQPTLPTEIGFEKKCNPYLRWDDLALRKLHKHEFASNEEFWNFIDAAM